MMCLRQFLLFLILLPFPTAPPLLMFMIAGLMWVKLRPCIYCSILLVVVFSSSCNTGFMSLSFPDAMTPLWIQEPTSNSTLPGDGQLLLQKNETEIVYAEPIPNRCWCDLNNGRLLWPVLSGYRYLDGKLSDKRVKKDLKQWRKPRNPSRTHDAEAASTPEAPVEPSSDQASSVAKETQASSWWDRIAFKNSQPSPSIRPSKTEAYDPLVPEDPSHDDPLMNWDGVSAAPTDAAPTAPPSTHSTPLLSPSAVSWWSSLAKSRYDLRVHGIGMVVDLGLTRTEEDVKEEIMEMLDWKERRRSDGMLEQVEEMEEVATADETDLEMDSQPMKTEDTQPTESEEIRPIASDESKPLLEEKQQWSSEREDERPRKPWFRRLLFGKPVESDIERPATYEL